MKYFLALLLIFEIGCSPSDVESPRVRLARLKAENKARKEIIDKADTMPMNSISLYIATQGEIAALEEQLK